MTSPSSRLEKRNDDMNSSDRFRGALLGLAVGDALGTTVEFRPRGTFRPVTDMIGGGPFDLEPGQWTDDTSMALCLAASLAETGRFDLADQIDRYCRWHETGYLSSNGRCFDIGNTIRAALRRYRATGNPAAGSTDPRSAGNGCIMRLAPVVLYFHPDEDRVARHAAESCLTTHGASECLEAASLLGRILARALAGQSKERILQTEIHESSREPRVAAIENGDYLVKTESQIRGSGYVIDCLEAALWCFARTETFEAAVLAAANLGDDADTTAAVCGQVAGAFYGESGVPRRWIERLTMADEIRELADRVKAAGEKSALRGHVDGTPPGDSVSGL